MSQKHILLYVPNIIGYVRLCFVLFAFLLSGKPIWFLLFYILSAILDGFDGYAARRLNQVSAFGALLDVIVDNIGRGMLWCQIFSWGYFVSVIEWLTLVSTHCKGPNWKSLEGTNPWIVQKVMANGFKTPWGIYAITGLHVLPIWIYACQTEILSQIFPIPIVIQMFVILILILGRLLCLRVELYFIIDHFWRLCCESDK